MIRRAVHMVTPTGAFTAWATLLVMLVSVGILAVLTIGYVTKVDREADRRNVERQRQICGLIVMLDDRNGTLPPATDPDTARFRVELHRYRLGLGC